MTKIVKNQDVTTPTLPTVTDEIFKLKIDRESQKFYVEEREEYGLFDEVIIRPLDIYTKLKAYNDDFEVTSESTLFKLLSEARDSRGNTAKDAPPAKICGRIIWQKDTSKLSEDAKKTNKEKAKYYAFLFGIAYIKDQEPVLVDMQIGGGKYMEIVNLLKKIKEEKNEYHKAEIKIKAFKNSNAEFDWPELEFMPDLNKELPVTGLEPLFDTVEGYVEYHNEGISKKEEKFKNKPVSGFKKKTSFKKNTKVPF